MYTGYYQTNRSFSFSSMNVIQQALVAGAKHFGFLYEDQIAMEGKAGRGAYRVLRRAKAGKLYIERTTFFNVFNYNPIT